MRLPCKKYPGSLLKIEKCDNFIERVKANADSWYLH